MKEFNELRRLAREKRDNAIKVTRKTYQAELEQINDLELRLKPRKKLKGTPKPLVPLRVKIMNAAPKDSTRKKAAG